MDGRAGTVDRCVIQQITPFVPGQSRRNDFFEAGLQRHTLAAVVNRPSGCRCWVYRAFYASGGGNL